MKNKITLLTAVCIIICSSTLGMAASEERSNSVKKDYLHSEVEKQAKGYENIKNVALTVLAFTANIFLVERIISYVPPTLLITSLAASICLFAVALRLDLHKWCESHKKNVPYPTA